MTSSLFAIGQPSAPLFLTVYTSLRKPCCDAPCLFLVCRHLLVICCSRYVSIPDVSSSAYNMLFSSSFSYDYLKLISYRLSLPSLCLDYLPVSFTAFSFPLSLALYIRRLRRWNKVVVDD
jgi:hypothetical protein